MKTGFRLVVLALTLFLATGCAGGKTPSSSTGEEPSGVSTETTQSLLDPEGNLTLYVSNQSSEIDPVDIEILIDGEVVIDRDFAVEGGHNWSGVVLRLLPGTHTLLIRSHKGKASMERSFEVTGRHWAVINYWYHSGLHGTPTPKQFEFYISDKVIKFM
jgi:hypothetical protein